MGGGGKARQTVHRPSESASSVRALPQLVRRAQSGEPGPDDHHPRFRTCRPQPSGRKKHRRPGRQRGFQETAAIQTESFVSSCARDLPKKRCPHVTTIEPYLLIRPGMPQLSGQDFSGAGNAPTSVEIAGENRRLVCGGPMPAYVPGMSNWMPPSLRLEGEWIGKYQCHFEEVIRIDFVEGRWVAKIR